MSSRRPTAPRGPGRRPPGDGRAERPVERPASSRPAPAARPRSVASRGGAGGTGPWGLSRRAAVLAVVLLALAALVAPYLRSYVDQRAEIAALESDVAAQEADLARLERELARWDDPAYVTAQARQRLHMVLPGETGYVVLDPPEEKDPRDGGTTVRDAAPDRAWFGAVWESVVLAGQEGPEVRRAPGVDGPDGDPEAPGDIGDVAP